MAGIKPNLPKEGDKVSLFGVVGVVTDVVPESDYSWQITLSTITGGGSAEKWTVSLPTDYRTDDGHYCWS